MTFLNFLISQFKKFFGVKTGAYDSLVYDDHATHVRVHREIESEMNRAYDPAEDPEKVMTGEVESYFG